MADVCACVNEMSLVAESYFEVSIGLVEPMIPSSFSMSELPMGI
jgi:hypothetical protein